MVNFSKIPRYLEREVSLCNQDAIHFSSTSEFDSKPFLPSNSILPTDRPHPETAYYRIATTKFRKLIKVLPSKAPPPTAIFNVTPKVVQPPSLTKNLCRQLPTPVDSRVLDKLWEQINEFSATAIAWVDELGQEIIAPLECWAIMRERLHLYVIKDRYENAEKWLLEKTSPLDKSLGDLGLAVWNFTFKELIWVREQGLASLVLKTGVCARSALEILGPPGSPSRISLSMMDDLLESVLRLLPSPSPYIQISSHLLSIDVDEESQTFRNFEGDPLVESLIECLRLNPSTPVLLTYSARPAWGGRIVNFQDRNITIIGTRDESEEARRQTDLLFSLVGHVETKLGGDARDRLPFETIFENSSIQRNECSDGGVELIADVLSRFTGVGKFNPDAPQVWFDKMKLFIIPLAIGTDLETLLLWEKSVEAQESLSE